METHDHAMFSGPGETLYTRLGGIMPASPGYKTITIKPHLPRGLTYVNSSLRTVMGEIVSNWDIRNGYVHHVTVPANATARVYVPASDARKVTEGGAPAGQARGVRFLRMDGQYAVFTVDSGTYVFSVPR